MTLSLGRVPFKNLKAHPVRTVILVLLAAAQAACVFGGAALAAVSRAELELADARLGADIIMYPYEASYHLDMDAIVMQGTPVASYASRSTLARVDECDGIEALTHQVYVPGDAAGPAWVIGFDVNTDFVLGPWMEEGAGFILPEGTAMVGANVPNQGEIVLYGRTWPVAAHLQKTGSPLDDAAFLGMADMPVAVADAQAAGVAGIAGIDPLSDYSALLIRVADGADIESVANWLKVYVTKAKTVRSEAALASTATGIGWQGAMIAGVAALAWLVLLAALAVAQSMAMRERAGELFVWRTCGASRRAIRRAHVLEAVVANVAGAVAGAIVAGAVAGLAGVALPVGVALSAAAAAVVLSALAGWAATSAAVRRVLSSPSGQMLVAA